MKLSKEYIIKRLETTSVHDLAKEIAKDASEQAEKVAFRGGHVYVFDMDATVEKFENMLKPFAPVKATTLMRSMGVEVVEN